QSGGTSSGLISFLEVFDRAAGSIKSGGVTRRAAKMVCLDDDHPEILEFIRWKKNEEEKAQALIRQGYSSDFEGEAYHTVAGQNANNSVRLSSAFFKALENNQPWPLRARSKERNKHQILSSPPAQEIWDEIISAAWACADPGLQFADNISAWHTCPESGPIRVSNPCSEYMFLDDSACNLASLNLLKFFDESGKFQMGEYLHTVRVMLIAQEILVDYAGYPTQKISQNSHDFRPLGLGFCGLGASLMRQGIPYDSEEARSWAGALSATLHGMAELTSVELAKSQGAFKAYGKNKKAFLKVMKKHQQAVNAIDFSVAPEGWEGIIHGLWEEVLRQGKRGGFRHAQVTVMAPTGTIGLVMDCETTGIEPEFALIRSKKMVGGGVKRLVSSSVEPALRSRAYTELQIQKILQHLEEYGSIEGAPELRAQDLPVFDCAQRGGTGTRVLSSEAHVLMMAAVQPFLSGAISKTVNLPQEASPADIEEIFFLAKEKGLKSISIYRDASKMSQPLTTQKNQFPRCPECGSETSLESGCFRCINCGFTTGCVS
ncbi:MAG: ribonucleoside-diphosphate reductase, adenosylcobalamin-dependent, partial [Bdellovibrio sp. CG10_big_fil_rev_8_21_14_0_10_47_8]